MVIVDGQVGLQIDCSQLVADNIHAVQWYGTFGEVEFAKDYLLMEKRWHQKPNEPIKDIGVFRKYVDQWIAAKKEYDEKLAADKAKEEQQKLDAEAMAQRAIEDMKKLMAGELPPPPVTSLEK
jgi:hypothetical protein